MVSPSPLLSDLSHLSTYPIPPPCSSLSLSSLGNEQKHAKGQKNTGSTHTLESHKIRNHAIQQAKDQLDQKKNSKQRDMRQKSTKISIEFMLCWPSVSGHGVYY